MLLTAEQKKTGTLPKVVLPEAEVARSVDSWQPWSKPPTFLGPLGNPVDMPPLLHQRAQHVGILSWRDMSLLHSDISQAIHGKSGANS